MSVANPNQRMPIVDSTGCLTRYGLTLFGGIVQIVGGPSNSSSSTGSLQKQIQDLAAQVQAAQEALSLVESSEMTMQPTQPSYPLPETFAPMGGDAGIPMEAIWQAGY